MQKAIERHRTAEAGQPFSWSKMYAHRRSVAGRFGRVYDLPLAKRARDVLLSQVSAGERVLEIGAGERRMARHLAARFPGICYESMDIDLHGQHDYHDLAGVRDTFDCIFAFEVVEHLELTEIVDWLRRLGELLAPGGRLLLSTPNVFYPPAYLRDASHRTPLCYDELGGLVEAAGLSVDRIWRIYHDPLHRVLLRRVAFGWLFRLLGLDYARQIVLVAQRARD